MTEPSDSDHADARPGAHAPAAQGRKDGDACAQKRSRGSGIDRVRQGKGETSVDPDPTRETAHVSHAGGFLARAEVLLPGAALLAIEARRALPTDADALTDPERAVAPGGRHLADDLVSGHERVFARGPVVVDQVQIAVADSAVRDLDLDVVRSDCRWLVLIGHQGLPGAERGKRGEGHLFAQKRSPANRARGRSAGLGLFTLPERREAGPASRACGR